jgi:ribosomal protein S1
VGVESVALNGAEKVPCLVVMKGGVKGLIPLPEAGVPFDGDRGAQIRWLRSLLGQEVEFVVTRIDFDGGVFTASRKEVVERRAAALWPKLEVGQVHKAVVRRVLGGYSFVDLGGVEALLPAGELSYGWVGEVRDLIQPGQELDVKIVSLDRENKRIVVSVKALVPNPWPGCARRYVKGGVYSGTVVGVQRYGVFVNLEPGVDALCTHMKYGFPERGDLVRLVVTRVDVLEEGGRISGRLLGVIRRPGRD